MKNKINSLASDGSRPRVLLLADRPGWVYDTVAQAISTRLSDEFEFRIEHVLQAPDLSAWAYDLLYVFFWGETYHRRFIHQTCRVAKEISSHRWALEAQYGKLSPAEMVERYLAEADTVTATSRRLQEIFGPFREVLWVPSGFEPRTFSRRRERSGPLRIGWAGNEGDPCKGINDVLRPATGSDFELLVAGGSLSHAQMGEFYNSIDVLCIASTAEGEPLTLIEGMACGCFPVCVDVGIVPELVRHRENGLVVNRTPAAFRAAFHWCTVNIDRVRESGRHNAEEMRISRTWDHVSAPWRVALRRALGFSSGKLELPSSGAAVQNSANGIVPIIASSGGSAVGTGGHSSPMAVPSPSSLIAKADAQDADYEARLDRIRRLGPSPRVEVKGDVLKAHQDREYRSASGVSIVHRQDAVTYSLDRLRATHTTIVDIGAWLGNFAFSSAKRLLSSTIFAFEPHPESFRFIVERAPENLIAIQLAIADGHQIADLYLSQNSQAHTLDPRLHDGPGQSSLRVRCIPFDVVTALVGGEIDFLKLNAQGAELCVLSSPSFIKVKEAVVELHLDLGDPESMLRLLSRTHRVTVLEQRSSGRDPTGPNRFMFLHLERLSC